MSGSAARWRRYVYRSPVRRVLVRAVDAVGDAICGGSLARAQRSLPLCVERILAIKLDHLGDLILATPALRSLRAGWPDARLDVVVPPACIPLLDHLGLADEIFTLEPFWIQHSAPRWADLARLAARLRARRYDLALDLRGDPVAIALATIAGARFRAGFGDAGLGFLLDREHRVRPGVHQSALLLEAAGLAGGAPLADPMPRLSISPAERERARARLGNLAGHIVLFHLGAGDPRNIFPPEQFAAVARALLQAGRPIGVIGTAPERPLVDRFATALGHSFIDLTGALSLRETIAVIESAAVLLDNDTGPAHMAAAVGTPVVVAFATTNDPRRWGPMGARVGAVEFVPGANPAMPGCVERLIGAAGRIASG